MSRREELLLDHCALRGFDFTHAVRGGPLVGIRRSQEWVDTIHIVIDGDCLGWRHKAGTDSPPESEVCGSAETVMVTVINWGATRVCSEGGAFHALG